MAANSSKRGTPRKATPHKDAGSLPSSGVSARPATRAAMPRAGASHLGVAPKAPKAAKAPKGAKKALFSGPGANARKSAAPSGQVPASLASAPAKGGSPEAVLGQRSESVKLVGIVLAAVCALGFLALIVLFVLRDSPLFSVEEIVVEPTEHVSQADVANLLHVDEGMTLLNYDADDIASQLKRNLWVGSISIERQFPHTLKICVEEQRLDELVVMNSGSMGWFLGASGVWIEPVRISTADGQSVNDAALQIARKHGALLITGVPATVEPQAGSEATDDVLSAVKAFRSGFSADFLSKIVSFDASSTDAISCVMESGVQVSLGSATNISYKEQVASALLEKYAGQITYINVRTPSSASVRRVGSSDVTQGTGADGESATSGDSASGQPGTDEGSADESGAADESGSADESVFSETAGGAGEGDTSSVVDDVSSSGADEGNGESPSSGDGSGPSEIDSSGAYSGE
ncbi:cell division protein FtsQ/DivIB [Paratractidigestivibacter sp.]|uniref:cell division protein FtsQ/DivIB n=1 Tax=Paratractidigestivibacter sp. TaxID=2847316 RepID=UPI002ABE83F4|nr:FtsQ-type POTRA domain-containing protein [Paratractidigestivibacter sp.]